MDTPELPPVSQSTNDNPVELTLEQKFNLRSFETQVQNMSHKQAQDFLVKLYEELLLRDQYYKRLLKHEWGLEPSSKF